MGSMCAHRKNKLKQDFVGGQPLAVAIAAELKANLAELARPVGQLRGASGVTEEPGAERVARVSLRTRRKARAALRPVEASADEPATSELIVAGDVEAEWLDDRDRILCNGARPDQLRARHKRAIDRPLQRLPPQRGVEAIELIPSVAERATSTRERSAKIEVCRFRNIAIGAQMSDGRKIAPLP